MTLYTYTKTIKNGERLISEIKAAGLTTAVYVNVDNGNESSIAFSTSLTPEQEATLSSVVAAHMTTINTEAAATAVQNAMDFGAKLTISFTAENVALGITQLGLTNHIRKTLREVKDATETGSLYDAITEIKSLDSADFDATILTAARLLVFRNKIETYLNVPLATAWNDPETWL